MSGRRQADDPSSLSNLEDIIVPEAIPWWPPAPGWYAFAALAVIAVALTAFLLVRRWRATAYRRAALESLSDIEARLSTGAEGREPLRDVPVLLKRVALASFTRADVAALSGDDWLAFLDRSSGGRDFVHGRGRVIPRLAYDPGVLEALDESEVDGLLADSRRWIVTHDRSREPGR